MDDAVPDYGGSKGSGLAIIHSVPGNSIHKDPATGIPFETNVLLQDLTPVTSYLLQFKSEGGQANYRSLTLLSHP